MRFADATYRVLSRRTIWLDLYVECSAWRYY